MLILDWDVHHGNGTNDIFHARPDVLFVCIHESPLYPGTGPAERHRAAARGRATRSTCPCPAGVGRRGYVLARRARRRAARRARTRPSSSLISAGFDAHRDDPLAGCRVTDAGFARDGGVDAARWPTSSARRSGVVLEGGYDLEALAESMVATLEVVGAEEPVERPAVTLHPLAAQAAGRLAERWPLVGAVARASCSS